MSAPNVSCNSFHGLSSDHSPIILHLERDIKRHLPSCHLHNSKTNWALFQNLVDDFIEIKLSLSTEDGITTVVEYFNKKVFKMQLSLPLLNFSETILHYIMFRQKKSPQKSQHKWTKSI